jgi:DNA-directed RNA polymerase subunit RPC12/RpoP
MGIRVICPGCGALVEAEEGEVRARIRCPQCGVMCDLPQRHAPQVEKRPAPALEETDPAAEGVLLQNDPVGQDREVPKKKRATGNKPVPKASPPRGNGYPYEHSNEDDGKPYFVPDLAEERTCPSCKKLLELDAVLCTSCGYNLQTGEKTVQEYEPLQRDWWVGWPYSRRLGIFIGIQGCYFPLVIVGMWVHQNVPGPLFSWLVLVAMLAFLLGSFFHVHLTRNRKGRVKITRTWYICFIPRPPAKVDAMEFAGVVHGPQSDEGCFKYFILMALSISPLLSALVFLFQFVFSRDDPPSFLANLLVILWEAFPALFWYYWAFMRQTFYVSLTNEHGYPEFTLFESGDQERVRDMTESIRKITPFPSAKY